MSSGTFLLCGLLVTAGFGSACHTDDPQAVKAAAIRSGDELMAVQKYASAVAAYRRAVGADPDDGALRFKLATALEQAQQWTSAANEAMNAADLLPGDFDARFLAARLVLGQSRFDDSLKITTALLRERPTDVDLLILSGTAAAGLLNPTWALYKLAATGGVGPDYERGCTSIRRRDDPDRDRAAESTLRRAVALAPDSVDAGLALVNFLWAVRRANDSEDLLRALTEDHPEHGFLAEVAGYFFLARNEDALGEKYLASAAAANASYTRAPRLALADHYLATGRFEQALFHLTQIPPGDNIGGVIAARRAEAQLGGQHYELAQREIDGILARYPKHHRGLALRAMLLMKLGRPAEALLTARAAVAADAKSAEARVVLGEALVAAKDQSGAFAEYAEALRLAPWRTELLPTAAELSLATGRNQQALDFARQAVGLFPDNIAAKLVVATAQVRLRDYTSAATALEPLLKLTPRPLAVHVELGRLEAGRGNDAAARAAFDGALKVDPQSLDALAGHVDLDLARQQVTTARQRIDAVMPQRLDEAEVLKISSRVFRAEQDLQGAETVLRRALAMQPADVETALLLADTLSARTRYDDAVALLEQLLVRNPAFGPALTALGAVLERLGRLDEAEARYKSVLAVNPGDGPAAARLALLHVARDKNLDVALGFLSEATRASPDDAGVSDALGWVYVQKDLRLLAVERLEEATRLSPRTATFHYHLGIAQARAGNGVKARAALMRALALDLDGEDRRAAETALAGLGRP